MLHPSVPRGPDRRRSPRFPLPIGRVSAAASEATLLNISRQGMAIEVPVATGFSRGDAHSFTLQDLNHSVEVKGRVCWVRSDWRDHGAPGSVKYIQVAGLTFEEILTREPSGIWSNLQPIATELEELERPDEEPPTASGNEETSADVSDVSSRTVSVSRPEPPSLIEPHNGANLADSTVTVICSIAIPEEVTSVSINSFSATLEGERAAAEVALGPGVNRLSALVCRENGSYRTYPLGQVTRKESS